MDEIKEKIILIRKLVKVGRGIDLVYMTMGLLECCNKENVDVIYPENSGDIITCAHLHLEFTAKFGDKEDSAEENGYYYFAYPKEYEEWLEMGAPGLFLDELKLYIKKRPINNG